MPVLERSELEASSLSDLHAVADQVGIEGFRRLRKADLIDAILGDSGPGRSGADTDTDGGEDQPEAGARPRRRRAPRARRVKDDDANSEERDSTADSDDDAPSPRRSRRRGTRGGGAREDAPARRGATAGADADEGAQATPDAARIAAGVVEVLGNGSAFLRVDPPEPSDEDVYISAAQVRRCELVSGDRVTGPVRTPRRSERYPSLVRIDTINGDSADAVSDGPLYDDLPVDWPSERIALGSEDKTLEAIEWLTPLGLGSRAVIVGARHAGKTETLRRLLEQVHGREDLDVTLVLTGARPEEIAQWREGPLAPVAALTFAASADAHDQAVERAIDAAKRVAARGGNALVLIDSLDALHPHVARKALVAARNLRDSGSLTVIATAAAPLGGETSVIALEGTLASTGRRPVVDLVSSGTLKAELLVGDDGAEAIAKARADAVESRG